MLAMRQRNSIFLVFACIFVSAFLVIGCGASQPTSSGNANHGTATTEPSNSVSSTSTSTAASTPTPAATSASNAVATPTTTGASNAVATPTSKPVPTGVQTTPSTGAVRLLLNKSSYAPYETITVTIQNGFATPITTTDHQSGCTMVLLQMQDAKGSWQMQGLCREGIATRMVTLAAGSSTVQSLSPQSGTFARGSTWARGQYRFVFTFSKGAPDPTHELGMGSSATDIVYSATFVVA
ncbi:MAG TPA: hypothetical protein VFB12_19045 [Ktedonobacteraceae bacterium]|nr:hypothetical protein [Ktedonobacteraceae bacterium]